MIHEVSEGFIRKIGKNYFMRLTIDGQKKQKKTGTNDPDKAERMLHQWREQERLGVSQDATIRYEELRDDYLKTHTIGHPPKDGGPSAIQRDLDMFFKNIRAVAIGGRLEEFREWRESLDEVLESKTETLAKEITLRKMKMQRGRRTSLTAAEVAKIEKEATAWVENGVQATTDKRLKVLRAIMYHAVKVSRKLTRGDVPHFPIRGAEVDNVKRGKFSTEDFERIVKELWQYEQLLRFRHKTGMRSKQVAAITWDMIDHDNVLRMPGFLTKNGQPYSLVLTNGDGKPYPEFKFMVEMKQRPHGVPVFDLTNFRDEWRKACHKLKLGVYDPETRAYRGAQPHDFRRTAATNMIKKGASQIAAMTVTGHKTPSMFQRYGIEDPELQRNALD